MNFKLPVFIVVIAAPFLLQPLLAKGQSAAISDGVSQSLMKLKTVSDSVSDANASERPYLQFDKDYYTLGDTIWYKAYLLKATSLTASDKSAIMYIDMVDDSDKVVKRFSIPVQNGLGWGNISLDEKELLPGTYTLRAYTGWMRNFNNDYFFNKSFYLTGKEENYWLINRQIGSVNTSQGTNVKLLFADINRKPDANNMIQLQVYAGTKHLYKQALQTDKNGLLDFNMKFPEQRPTLLINAENTVENKRAVISVTLNRPENTDVQFLPEGGNLVAGLPTFVGFKAIGEDGKGVDISGVVVDNNKQQVAEFKSLHNGMGSFDLTPHEGEKYIARVNLPGGLVKEYPLPEVKASGLVLHVQNQIGSDSLKVSLTASNDFAQPHNNYFLIARARGIVCYAAVVNFKDGNFIKRKIAKSLFPAGIVHFTLMTANRQPLNERITYIRRDDLHIQLVNAGNTFQPKDSVALKIKVTDGNGDPVSGNFSLAVTDDAKVKTDSLSDFNISNYLLLSSDLKGYVERPGYYLASQNPEAWQALDNLLLTQGWVGYDWQNIFNPPANTYQPERDFKVQGNVVNVFNKPVKSTNVFLFSVKPSMVLDTMTNDDGKFVFDHLPRVDTPVFVLKAVNKNGKSFNVRITMDELQPPAFLRPAAPLMVPWYVNSDSTLINYTRNNVLQQQLAYYKATGHLLKEVKITSKKIIKGSQNLNGPGEADLVMDEKELEKQGKKTWLQLFEEKIEGFRVAFTNEEWGFVQDTAQTNQHFQNCPDAPTHEWFMIHDKPIKIYVDGVSITQLVPATCPLSSTGAYIDMKNYLDGTSAEDIKGIEVCSSDKYSFAYTGKYGLEYGGLKIGTVAIIEVTTRSGHGPIMGNTPGMYLYKPMALSWPKKFYKPRYLVSDTTKRAPDQRATINWEPNIFTDRTGMATVSFFAADKPSTYTLTIEGTDMSGNFGSQTTKLNIEAIKPKETNKTEGK